MRIIYWKFLLTAGVSGIRLAVREYHRGLFQPIGAQVLFSDRLLERFRNPRYSGRLEPPAIPVRVMNPACGDTLRLTALVEAGRIVEARFQTRGCTASIAASDALAEWLTGKTADSAAALRAVEIEEILGGLAPESRHAAVLAVDAARALAAAAGGVRH